VRILPAAQWHARAAAHEERVDGWLGGHLDRRRRGEKHPVFDFLFTYYSYRPAQLRRWHPGAGVVLAGASGLGPDYVDTPDGATVDTAGVLSRRSASSAWIARLLRGTGERPAQLGCFGLHEWAMVYRQTPDELRHNAYRLRLGPDGTAAVVDELPVRCSHFDAYRFFTPAARPLNLLLPTRDSQPKLEQPGCLHANMDLYKWAYKLSPLVGSDLVADCFALASEIRTLDMRASPYDLADLGYDPVPVETPAGRAEYARAQRDFADRAAVLRAQLLAELESLVPQEDHHNVAHPVGSTGR
jgi:hypothetical protein